jgi:hypothetical protein
MPTLIEDVQVDNPTGVWMQLMNTRRRVLDKREKWNNDGWYSATVQTMCLSNALRYVAHGQEGKPTAFSRDIDNRDQAELITMLAIVKVARTPYTDIPEFNDETGRRFTEIVRVLDTAIEMVAPYAKTFATTYADDVMTAEEKKEIQAAVRKAEHEMWKEYRAKWGAKRDGKGLWRRADGKFAWAPQWVRTEHQPLPPLPPLPARTKADQQNDQFRAWLDDHTKRGWDTYWDELLKCDEKDPSYETCQQARKALALA